MRYASAASSRTFKIANVTDRAGGISVCICTCRRLPGLVECLNSVMGLRVPQGVAIDVNVVDNDPLASAHDLVMSMSPSFPLTLRYFCEPESGVGHARNRCLREARGEWVAFIDDDEAAEAGWLAALWEVAGSGLVDGVFGPVLAEFEHAPPAWLVAAGVHVRQRAATGTPMSWGNCRTGNVLFRRTLAKVHGGFDARFATSGGEDSEFFWRCLDGGAKLVWCDEAIVHERIPAARMTRAWLLNRAFNGGRTFARLRAARRGPLSYVFDAAWGLAGLLTYILPAVVGRGLRLDSAFACECKVAGALGKLAAPLRPATGEYGAGPTRRPIP